MAADQNSDMTLFYFISRKNVTFDVLSQFFEISHTDCYDIIKTHTYGFFALLDQICGFWTKIVLSLKTTGLLQK